MRKNSNTPKSLKEAVERSIKVWEALSHHPGKIKYDLALDERYAYMVDDLKYCPLCAYISDSERKSCSDCILGRAAVCSMHEEEAYDSAYWRWHRATINLKFARGSFDTKEQLAICSNAIDEILAELNSCDLSQEELAYEQN